MTAYDRRKFLRTAAITGVGLGLVGRAGSLFAGTPAEAGKRVGIIGLDTSHSVEFTKMLNAQNADPAYHGFKVVAAYPQGSKDIASSLEMVPGNLAKVKELGVEIVDSIATLLEKVDVVLLESNDGRVHLEQALPVFKAGKRIFIDKPIAASLADTKAIFKAAEKHNVPVFSSSALRFIDSIQQVKQGKIGKVAGADVYTPSPTEKTHPDLFWYGIHGVEMLFALMGTGCRKVTRTTSADMDQVTGVWADGRIGTLRGVIKGPYGFGGHAFGEKGIMPIGDFNSYQPLVLQITSFFQTGVVPVDPQETIEMMAFMEAADASKKKKGALVMMNA
ncbi:Gfo/Idh/MocA family oxidoreductase [Chitinophaga varians]|uniref:Gfo/Idh/MocA family oxidoreductase n=1 Tax=Chitinophaga varians TaxID=2202339 RepID=A0A847RNF7_9BACT|nr:Gfo/Idh/MocA family oxidoreductase [Chitinophaga varians]NLR63164.1 Gfo/Idh/MocA family oxidoreductase [Chitinophaga varians]